jgi:hypothetical protein
MTDKKPTLIIDSNRPVSGAKTLKLKRKRRIVVNADVVQAKPKKPAKNANKKPTAPKTNKTPPSEIKAKELDNLLHNRFTSWQNYQPLTIGIHKDIHRLISAEQLPYSKRVVQKVLRRHVRHESYQSQLQSQSERVGLQ